MRVGREQTFPLENGYAISVREEQISKVGRSIFREISEWQFVLEIHEPSGRVTKRMPIPAVVRSEIAHFLKT